MANSILGVTADGRKIVMETTPGPSSYVQGGFNYKMAQLEHATVISITNNKGLISVASYVTASKNSLTIVVRGLQYACSVTGLADELAAGVDISGCTFTIIAIGD